MITAKDEKLHKLELTISRLLRSGVLFAGVFLLVGWLWLLWNNGTQLETFQEYQPRSLIDTARWMMLTQDRAMLISLVGLILLVCLPLARVFATGILFLRQKDFFLSMMAFIVFAALVTSFLLGIEI
jgi:uncharacterized membrane protein